MIDFRPVECILSLQDASSMSHRSHRKFTDKLGSKLTYILYSSKSKKFGLKLGLFLSRGEKFGLKFGLFSSRGEKFGLKFSIFSSRGENLGVK